MTKILKEAIKPYGLMIAVMFLAVAITIVPGCVSTIPTVSNQQAAVSIESITAVRKIATASLKAGKITVAKDQEIQADLDVLRQQLEIALTLRASNPNTAAATFLNLAADLAAITAKAHGS